MDRGKRERELSFLTWSFLEARDTIEEFWSKGEERSKKVGAGEGRGVRWFSVVNSLDDSLFNFLEEARSSGSQSYTDQTGARFRVGRELWG